MEDNANESGNESERSASNSTDESDSDDSSEMDYEENERKRKMCLEHILFLEKKFLGENIVLCRYSCYLFIYLFIFFQN